MSNKPTTEQTDEQKWDELLSSEEGALALEHLLAGAELDIETGNLTEDED
jgi:hypothetical protein